MNLFVLRQPVPCAALAGTRAGYVGHPCPYLAGWAAQDGYAYCGHHNHRPILSWERHDKAHRVPTHLLEDR